eukprot:scaffold517_cov119-Cylindrotheca_fusiformis.AAC.3
MRDTMTKRRKRSDSDIDESIEKRYMAAQRPISAEANSKSPEEVTRKEESKQENSEPSHDIATQKESKPSDEQQRRIERLRLQKKCRKEKKISKARSKDQGKASIVSKPGKTGSESKPNTTAFLELAKGVNYRDVVIGNGPEVQNRKKIRVAYVLRAKERYGKILDTSNDFRFRVGRGEVIQGWDIGVMGMRQGGKRHLRIPPQAGYGQRDVGAGKGGLLFFEVTVLDC